MFGSMFGWTLGTTFISNNFKQTEQTGIMKPNAIVSSVHIYGGRLIEFLTGTFVHTYAPKTVSFPSKLRIFLKLTKQKHTEQRMEQKKKTLPKNTYTHISRQTNTQNEKKKQTKLG